MLGFAEQKQDPPTDSWLGLSSHFYSQNLVRDSLHNYTGDNNRRDLE